MGLRIGQMLAEISPEAAAAAVALCRFSCV